MPEKTHEEIVEHVNKCNCSICQQTKKLLENTYVHPEETDTHIILTYLEYPDNIQGMILGFGDDPNKLMETYSFIDAISISNSKTPISSEIQTLSIENFIKYFKGTSRNELYVGQNWRMNIKG